MLCDVGHSADPQRVFAFLSSPFLSSFTPILLARISTSELLRELLNRRRNVGRQTNKGRPAVLAVRRISVLRGCWLPAAIAVHDKLSAERISEAIDMDKPLCDRNQKRGEADREHNA